MLLAIDVGNTHTVLGLYETSKLAHRFRVESSRGRTTDEHRVLLRSLLDMAGVDRKSVDASILASVVPAITEPTERALEAEFGRPPVVVGPGVRTAMPILYENPREVGADRIVNAVAAYERYKQGCIIVDFGTATTFDLVTAKGEYAGGAIAPGITTSADGLYQAASKLPRVEIVRPASVIGRNTVASMQAGLVFGYVGLVDEIVSRMRHQVDYPCKCVATGGLAPLIAKDSRTIEATDEMLTLDGLRLIYERNRSA